MHDDANCYAGAASSASEFNCCRTHDSTTRYPLIELLPKRSFFRVCQIVWHSLPTISSCRLERLSCFFFEPGLAWVGSIERTTLVKKLWLMRMLPLQIWRILSANLRRYTLSSLEIPSLNMHLIAISWKIVSKRSDDIEGSNNNMLSSMWL
jgi:hypothetical protein